MRAVFPFSAIVAQDEMKLALLATAVDPTIGGVLVFGDRGTGKSTAVRALAALMPPMRVVVGCRFAAIPTRPRLTATSAVPGAARSRCPAGGRRCRSSTCRSARPRTASSARSIWSARCRMACSAFEPGLLARANRGFLYIDEVNLLEDHLVDLLIDVAASGENVVEREGLSVRHPARFVLVGSGNPEEGELRPQLLDRFGLSVEVRTPGEIGARIEVLRRRDAFERDPAAFVAHWAGRTKQRCAGGSSRARERIADIDVRRPAREAARLCLKLGTDGLRGELTLMRAARALAGFEGARTVDLAHLRRVAAPALRHRLRRDPLDDSGLEPRVERAVADVLGA